MHPSAHPTPTPTAMADLLEYTGTLTQQAQARTKVLDSECHTVPILCLKIELDNTLRTPMHIEQAFPVGHFKQAEAAARRYKRGTRVTVQVPLVGLRLMASHAAHIHVIKPDQPTPETT